MQLPATMISASRRRPWLFKSGVMSVTPDAAQESGKQPDKLNRLSNRHVRSSLLNSSDRNRCSFVSVSDHDFFHGPRPKWRPANPQVFRAASQCCSSWALRRQPGVFGIRLHVLKSMGCPSLVALWFLMIFVCPIILSTQNCMWYILTGQGTRR